MTDTSQHAGNADSVSSNAVERVASRHENRLASLYKTTLLGPSEDRQAGSYETATRKPRVALIEPRALIRDIIVKAAAERGGNVSILAVARPEELSLDESGSIDAIVLSIGGRKFLDPDIQDEIAQILAAFPTTPLVVLADREGIDVILAALQRGLKGYLTTGMNFDIALEAIRFICTGGTFIPASSLDPIIRQQDAAADPATRSAATPPVLDRIEGLTERQCEVLNCLREGLANKAIAYKLNMCEGTVKVHVRRIMKRLGATNRTQVVSMTNQMLEKASPSTLVKDVLGLVISEGDRGGKLE
jgi:DNA-binding NarL/FixJ family response regulator